MPEVNFYHLTTTTWDKALPKLMEKVYSTGKRALILASDSAKVEEINKLLWTYGSLKFIPHGSENDGYKEEQPIFITHKEENPNKSEILVVLDSIEPKNLNGFDRILDMFDGSREDEVKKARARWSKYKDGGYKTSYLKQDESGKWESNS